MPGAAEDDVRMGREEMNFFEHQQAAKRNSVRLVALFGSAIGLIAVGLYLLTRAGARSLCEAGQDCPYPWWDEGDFLITIVFTTVFIAGTSAAKLLNLRGGGPAFALSLGAIEVLSATRDKGERRFRNIVEEMAIASGVPVPRAYVLENEPGINAFAAGWSVNDAAVTVTRGCLSELSRDELQGVVAHEFSHILNGDMRLNLRMIGVLFGVFLIGETGRIVTRVAFHGGGGVRRKGAPWPLMLLGLGLMALGYIGVFFGRMIQAALSRQREFLADASAVQFTRNPLGISGALKKIGGLSQGSELLSPSAVQVGHLLFSRGQRPSLFTQLLASHPPLTKRIRRIDPSFRGIYEQASAEDTEDASKTDLAGAEAPVASMAPGARTTGSRRAPSPGSGDLSSALGELAPLMLGGLSGTAPRPLQAQAEATLASIGAPTTQHLSLSQSLLDAMAPELREALHDEARAPLVIYALLLSSDPEERRAQLTALGKGLDTETADGAGKLRGVIDGADARMRLPLVDLATPALRRLSPGASEALLTMVEELILIDGKLTLFEFALRWLLRRRLGEAAKHQARPGRARSLSAVTPSIVPLLAVLARIGHPGEDEAAARAFHLGASRLPGFDKHSSRAIFDDEARAGFGHVAGLLDALTRCGFRAKKGVLAAVAHTVLADGIVTLAEAEILRLIAVGLDCPLPPFLDKRVQAAHVIE